jgi:hypothetical protein
MSMYAVDVIGDSRCSRGAVPRVLAFDYTF